MRFVLLCLVLLGLPVGVTGGVEGLLAIAKSRLQTGTVADLLSGSVVGVDLSVWLYQVAHLVTNDRSQENMTAIAGILVRRAQRLIAVGVAVVICADCKVASPAKAAERAARRAAKMKASVAAGFGDEVDGEADGATAEPCGSAGPSTSAASGPLDVHGIFQTIVLTLMTAAGIACVVAPYEADHQLAYLCWVGTIHAVVSVDSDMLVLGVKQLVLSIQSSGVCSLLTLAAMSRPLAAPRPGYRDPLGWLCAARDLAGETRGDALVEAALLLVACIARSDFNHFYGLGIASAIELVSSSLSALSSLLGAAPDDALGSVLHAFISTDDCALVNSVLAAQNKRSRGQQLDRAEIVAGMLRALTVFTRSLCVDVGRGVELPLSGPPQLTPAEIAITGSPCEEPELVRELAFGRRVRAVDGGTQPVDTPVPPPTSVVRRGTGVPQRINYRMLPKHLWLLFELDAKYVGLADALRRDRSAKVADWPSAITVAVLELFFKCIGEPLPRGSHGGSATKDDLRRAAILWLAVHRKPLPREGDDDYDDDLEDLAEEHRALKPLFAFCNCSLRDHTGLSCFELAVRLGMPISVAAGSAELVGVTERVPRTAPEWASLSEFQERPPPLCTYSLLSAHYQAHFPREKVVPLSAGQTVVVEAMCRPLARAVKRFSSCVSKPVIRVHKVIWTTRGFVTWVHGEVACSQQVGGLYVVTVCVRCVSTPASIAAASGLPAPAAASDGHPLVWTMCEILGVDCPCKQARARVAK